MQGALLNIKKRPTRSFFVHYFISKFERLNNLSNIRIETLNDKN